MDSQAKKGKIDRKILFSGFVFKLLAIMFLIEFVKGALLITFLPLYMKNALNATTIVIGWTLAVQYVGDNLLRTPIGWVIDRFGYRYSMLIGVVCTLLAVIIMALTSSYYWIVASCAILGLGTAPLWPCVITGATEVAGEQGRGTIMSVVYIAWLTGAGLGPFVITYFVNDHAYRGAFMLLCGMMALVVAIALFLPGKLKKRKWADSQGAGAAEFHSHQADNYKQSSNANLRAAQGGSSIAERMKSYFSEVKRSMNVSYLLFPAMFAQTFALGLLSPVLTLYAMEELKLTGDQFRMFMLVGGAVTVLLMIPVGKLVDRIGVRWFINGGFAIISTALFLLTVVRELTMLYVLVGLLGLGYALIIPSWNALIADAVPPDKRGAVWGFFLTIEGLGTTIGPVISGFLSHLAGLQAPFVASAAVVLLLLVMQWFIKVHPKQQMAG
ncbi:MFS transporter [Paenibacillus sp. J2TS4]|uniref:MFS transporter n=1 Tax=Paenibacillus sp. J2TS4 TaxID=2807194 RepID=UPI001B098C0D|nr:MFS transporter [Paenibacillus sp. J2TS4]GIP32862.1 hypothetical protein J2TS4_20720 [Paenibacillus sp. J2TS4]